MARRPSLRLGTRASKLARWQAEWVAERLRQLGHEVELVEITTRGDSDVAVPLSAFGGTGVFTKEIQAALLDERIDLAVHSLKDLPTEPVDGLTIAAVPPRESPADVVVVSHGNKSPRSVIRGLQSPLDLLPASSRIGTGSLRRQAQLRHARPDLEVADVRGNVDTRLRKLDEGQFDALVLAEAGLVRLGLAGRIAQRLPPDEFLPAIGQGALAIDCRADDEITLGILAPLDDKTTRAAVTAERALLAHLRGGCLAPIGAWGRVEGGTLRLSAVVLSSDGAQRLTADDSSSSAHAEAAALLGRQVAHTLLSQGAAELITSARSNTT